MPLGGAGAGPPADARRSPQSPRTGRGPDTPTHFIRKTFLATRFGADKHDTVVNACNPFLLLACGYGVRGDLKKIRGATLSPCQARVTDHEKHLTVIDLLRGDDPIRAEDRQLASSVLVGGLFGRPALPLRRLARFRFHRAAFSREPEGGVHGACLRHHRASPRRRAPNHRKVAPLAVSDEAASFEWNRKRHVRLEVHPAGSGAAGKDGVSWPEREEFLLEQNVARLCRAGTESPLAPEDRARRKESRRRPSLRDSLKPRGD